MLNTAIIGLGWWGRTHIEAIVGKSEKVKIRQISCKKVCVLSELGANSSKKRIFNTF